MRRSAVLVAVVWLAAACAGEQPMSVSTESGAPPCPGAAICVDGAGDVDGDGERDAVTHYAVDRGDHVEVGVIVDLADGTRLEHQLDPASDTPAWYGGLLGVAAIDDLPGDDVVALVTTGAHAQVARIVRWRDGHLEEVTEPGRDAPLDVVLDGAFSFAAGFSCDGGRFQRWSLERESVDETTSVWAGEVVDHEWHDGRLEEVERTPVRLGPAVDQPPSFEQYVGARCDGFPQVAELHLPEPSPDPEPPAAADPDA